MTHEQAVSLIKKGRGTHFDPAVVDAFLSVHNVLAQLSAEESRHDEDHMPPPQVY
jgi:HD-GYP domain-containing protein (c-di-GMP phosphodiesterase class II)